MRESSYVFKIGERVVYKPDTDYEDRGIIVSVYPMTLQVIWDSNGEEQGCGPWNCVPELIHDSPLTKALK